MDSTPRKLSVLAPAYLPQPELLDTVHCDALPDPPPYGLYNFDQTFTSTLQAPSSDGHVASMHMQFDIGLGGHSQSSSPSAPASAAPAEPTSFSGPPARPRKRKAPTLRADDWEPYKTRILDLHKVQKLSLPKVREIIDEEFGFKAELRQYRTRVSQWGEDKNIKPQEMKAIVRKRQRRKLIETNKRPLMFKVRGRQVELQKIERWMKRYDARDSILYALSHAPSTPSAVECHTISERGSPAPSPTTFGSDRELSPTAVFAPDMMLSTLEVLGKVYCTLPWWAAAEGFMFQDLPWFRFHSLLFSSGTLPPIQGFIDCFLRTSNDSASAESTTRDILGTRILHYSSGESDKVAETASKSTNITQLFRQQREISVSLDEFMPECFRVQDSSHLQMQDTLYKHSATLNLLEAGLFLVANGRLDGFEYLCLVEHHLDTMSDLFLKQLFRLPSPTVHSFTCRLLESLAGLLDEDVRKAWRNLDECILDRTIFAGPAGGRCLQLAIWSENAWLALFLIKSGAPRNPKLGSKEPFDQTPVELAKAANLQDVLESLVGQSSSYPSPPERRHPKTKRAEGEIALEMAIKARDTQQIRSLLNDGLDIDSARTYEDDSILEWIFFKVGGYYDIVLPYSQVSDHSWTVPGIISAASSSECLDLYFRARAGNANGEFEGEVNVGKYDMGQYDVLGRSIELAIEHAMTYQVRTLLSQQWIRDRLNLNQHLLNAAKSCNFDLMLELVGYGAHCMILEEEHENQIDMYLEDVLFRRSDTETLQKVLKIGTHSPERIFALNLDNIHNRAESLVVQNVQILIDHGLDLDSLIWSIWFEEFYTPLSLAIKRGFLEVVRCLADAGADINGSTGYESYTVLGEAVLRRKLKIVRFLIERGADMNQFANSQESTLVELAVCRKITMRSDLEIFKLLLESGADINGPNHRSPGTSWNTALTTAIMFFQEHDIICFLIEHGANIHQIGEGKGARTPLQAAAERNNVKIVKELLERGAFVNTPAAPDDGRTVLQAAAETGDLGIVKELLESGAFVNAPAAQEYGRTALQAACESARRSEKLITLLLDNGADISAPPAPRYGRTALQALCSSENPSSELMGLLIDHGADFNAPAADVGGVTALQGAAIKGNLRIAILLIEVGAMVNAPPAREEGRMALDGAAEWGRLDTVHLLLKWGATCMEPGRSGYDSAINFAEDNGHFAIADLLRGWNSQC